MVIYDKIFSVFHYIGFFGMILSATLVTYNKQKKKQKKTNIVTAAENKKKPEEDEIYPASRHDTENCDIMLLSFISIIIDYIQTFILETKYKKK